MYCASCSKGRQACGVEVRDGRASGARYLIATREVIVAAGVINSPQLLMLSGIGDGMQLQRYGIETSVHVPGVGRNLQDHIYAPYAVRSTRAGSYNSSLRGLSKYWHGLRYLMTQRGYTRSRFVRSQCLCAQRPRRERTGRAVDGAAGELSVSSIGRIGGGPLAGHQCVGFSAAATGEGRGRAEVAGSDAGPGNPPELSGGCPLMSLAAGLRIAPDTGGSSPVNPLPHSR